MSLSPGSRPAIPPPPAFAGSSAGRWTSAACLLQTKPPGRAPVPAPCRGRAAGGGRVGAARGLQLVPVGVVPVPSCGNWENIRENTSVLGWVQGLETLPGEWEGCWALPRVRALPSPAGCCPSAFLLLLILIEGEGNGVSLAWVAGAPSIQILPLGTDVWSLSPVWRQRSVLYAGKVRSGFCTSLLLCCSNCWLPPSKYLCQ